MRALAASGLSVMMTLLAAGCGPTPETSNARAAQGDAERQVGAFQQLEEEVIRSLAAVDRRVAARAHLEPREVELRHLTMDAILAEDPSLAVVEGTIDPFSFEARARGLAAVRSKLAAAPAQLPAGAPGMLPSPAFEKELLERLVDEEIVRLDEERRLPRSASALVQAVVETWSSPTGSREAAARDRWLARRLGEVRASVVSGRTNGANGLDVVRARELDDALDALEHDAEAAQLVHATAELLKLREALEAEASRPAPPARSEWPDVARRLRAHLGLALTPEALEARLLELEHTLRAAAERAVNDAHLSVDAVTAYASPLVLATGACAVAVPGSPVRSMSPPLERAASCRLRQAVAAADDAPTRAYALVAMHDHVVVALWALDVACGTATLTQATARHHPLSRPGPDVVARWERVALSRPTTAIGGGLTSAVLGAGDPQALARAWIELGEVPLDIAERELRASSSQL